MGFRTQPPNMECWNIKDYEMKKFEKQVQTGLDLLLKQVIRTSWEIHLTYGTDAGVLGFPKRKIKRKSQKNFQIDFS